MTTSYLMDTSVLVEITKANPHYSKYEYAHTITCSSIIQELYFILLKKLGEKIAGEGADKLSTALVDTDLSTIKRAMKFRLHHTQRNFSYADAMAYITALENGVIFLTADKAFKGLPNAEVVE